MCWCTIAAPASKQANPSATISSSVTGTLGLTVFCVVPLMAASMITKSLTAAPLAGCQSLARAGSGRWVGIGGIDAKISRIAMLSGTSAVTPENGGVGPERNLVLEALFVVADLANPSLSASPYRPTIAVV
jgi:hypothetical protein